MEKQRFCFPCVSMDTNTYTWSPKSQHIYSVFNLLRRRICNLEGANVECTYYLFLYVHRSSICPQIWNARDLRHTLRERLFDIYGGRQKYWRKNVCFQYFVENKFIYKNCVHNLVIFPKKFASPECKKNCFSGNLLAPHKYQMATP